MLKKRGKLPLFILGSGERLWIRNINRGLQHRDGIKAMGLDKHQEEGLRGEKGRALQRKGGERTEGELGPGALSLELVKEGKGNPGRKMEKEQLVK